MTVSGSLLAAVTKLSVAPVGRLAQAAASKTPTQLEFWSPANHASARERGAVAQPRIGFTAGLTDAGYGELDLTLNPHDEAIWCYMRPAGPPSFTPTLLRELISMRATLQRMFATLPLGEAAPIKYFVSGSRIPGIYNLGGDLDFFIACIRERNLEALRNYAHDWADVVYHTTVGFHVPLITIGLVQGDALGGGFEAALSFNVLVAEKSAKFGLPVLFNLFPGMGAFSFLSRKLDAARAQKMILSGRIYSATELYEMGLIDVLAEDGCGEKAVRDYIAHHRRHHTVHCCIRDVGMRVNPFSLEELLDIADIWAEHAMRLEESDLRYMERLASAQPHRI
jgi:Enoyl-CoA hydratase/carnithine racemase